ncbi:hypothetical protein Q2T49_34420, partial [Pseudomonas aeruginosa]|uniref:hypothetical protein n=1 Tax=Pseudomonas aeruginosa TaxID=287 RepID=UPI00265DE3BE
AGNPHFSASEFAQLAALCHGRRRHPEVALVITSGAGNPHFSASEFAQLAALCHGRRRHPEVALVIT